MRSYCINPECHQRVNPDNIQQCQNCGTLLVINNYERLFNISINPHRYRITERLKNNLSICTEIFEVEDLDSNENGRFKILKAIHDNDATHNNKRLFEFLTNYFTEEQKFLYFKSHSGIPKGCDVFSFSLSSGKKLQCLVMEKIEGVNLEQWVQINGPIQEDALEWLKQIVIILDFVHKKQFFHRDIKPSNIMWRQSDNQLVLIDFGTLKEINGTVINQNGRQTTTDIGSPAYMAPEQRNKQAVPQSDFYALGRTFVYLLTGQHPNEIQDILQDISRWPELINNNRISQSLIQLVNNLMEELPDRRPQDTQAILARIDEIQREIPTPSTPEPSNDLMEESLGGRTENTQAILPPTDQIQIEIATLSTSQASSVAPPTQSNSSANNLMPPITINQPQFANSPRRSWLIISAVIASGAIGLLVLILFANWIIQLFFSSEACDFKLADNISCGEESLIAQSIPAKSANMKKEGMAQFRGGNYAEAENYFENAWKIYPDPETRIYWNNSKIHKLIKQGEISPERVYTIAVAAPLSNLQQEQNFSDQGLEILRGVAYAQDNMINAQDNMIKERIYLQVVIANDANSEEDVPQIAEKLGKNKSILGAVGHYSSSVALAALPSYQANGLVLVSPASTSVELSSKQDFYRTAPDDAASGKAIGEYLKNQPNAQTVAIFWSQGEPFSESLKGKVKTSLGDNVNQVENSEIFNLNSDNFDAKNALSEAKKQGVTAIILIPDGGVTEKGLKNAYDVIEANADPNFNLTIIGADTLYNNTKTKDIVVKKNIARDKFLLAVSWDSSLNKKFFSDAKNFWGGKVSWLTGTAYDATLVFTEAIKTAIKTNENLTRENVSNVISRSNFNGATGEVRFKASARIGLESTLVKVLPHCQQESGNDFVPIKPDPGSCIP